MANQWAWIPAATVWGGNNDVLEHKGISLLDERLIWCKRESRAASQTISFSPSLSPFSLLLSPLNRLTLSQDLTVQAAAGALSPPFLCHFFFSSPLFSHHIFRLGCDPSCQHCSVFDLWGRRVCVGGEDVFTDSSTAVACWGVVNPASQETLPSVEDLSMTRNVLW